MSTHYNPTVEELEQLVQFTCRSCMGEAWMRVPFAPLYCAHCGQRFKGNVQILLQAA
jgi:hypothetical protein